MLCQECEQRQSTLHFTKIVNGEKTEFHICEVCASEKGEIISGTPNSFSIHNLISGLLDYEPSSPKGEKIASLRCERCGLTYVQFGKMGRFGCSQCHQYFSARLEPLFRRVHGSTEHVGKIPRRTGGKLKVRRDIEILKRQLYAHIENEEFEKAAVIRDEIRKLEQHNQDKS